MRTALWRRQTWSLDTSSTSSMDRQEVRREPKQSHREASLRGVPSPPRAFQCKICRSHAFSLCKSGRAEVQGYCHHRCSTPNEPVSEFRPKLNISLAFSLLPICGHKYHLMTNLMQLHCFDAPLRQSMRSQVVHNISTETSIWNKTGMIARARVGYRLHASYMYQDIRALHGALRKVSWTETARR